MLAIKNNRVPFISPWLLNKGYFCATADTTIYVTLSSGNLNNFYDQKVMISEYYLRFPEKISLLDLKLAATNALPPFVSRAPSPFSAPHPFWFTPLYQFCWNFTLEPLMKWKKMQWDIRDSFKFIRLPVCNL